MSRNFDLSTKEGRYRARKAGLPVPKRYAPLAKDDIKGQRLRQMRRSARTRGKAVPTVEQLEAMLPVDMRCPCCSTQMVWKRCDGQTTVITLQHDRSGEMRLICFRCNARHGQFEGDVFYEFGAEHKLCVGCNTIKPLDQFWRNSMTVTGRFSRCISCGNAVNANRRKDDTREARLAQARIYDMIRRARKRILAGA